MVSDGGDRMLDQVISKVKRVNVDFGLVHSTRRLVTRLITISTYGGTIEGVFSSAPSTVARVLISRRIRSFSIFTRLRKPYLTPTLLPLADDCKAARA